MRETCNTARAPAIGLQSGLEAVLPCREIVGGGGGSRSKMSQPLLHSRVLSHSCPLLLHPTLAPSTRATLSSTSDPRSQPSSHPVSPFGFGPGTPVSRPTSRDHLTTCMPTSFSCRPTVSSTYAPPSSTLSTALSMSRKVPLPWLELEGSVMLNEPNQGDCSWVKLGGEMGDTKECWGLKMDMGKPEAAGEMEGKGSPSKPSQAPPSPPASPSSERFPTSLSSDGRKVLRRRRSLSALSPPPSPTRRVRQRFGVGDDEQDEDLPPLPTHPLTFSNTPSIFPLSPAATTSPSRASPAPSTSAEPSLHRTSSFSRLFSTKSTTSPLRRRSTTALFRLTPLQIPELQLSRSSSADTKGKRAASARAGWMRELGVLSEESTEGRWIGVESCRRGSAGSGMQYGWMGGSGLGTFVVS